MLKDQEAATEVFRDRPTCSPTGRAQAQATQEHHEAMKRDAELRDPEGVAEYQEGVKAIMTSVHDLNAHQDILHARRDLIHAAEERSKGQGGPLDDKMVSLLNEISALALALAESSGTARDSTLSNILGE